MNVHTLEPIRKSLLVNVPPERAWEVFTGHMGDWWPLKTHSVLTSAGKPGGEVVVDGRVGGEICELAGGDRATWATILTWDPPRELRVTWRVNPEALTEWSVTFTPEQGATRVELVHGGWEAYGAKATEMRADYGGEMGWTKVLGDYENFVDD